MAFHNVRTLKGFYKELRSFEGAQIRARRSLKKEYRKKVRLDAKREVYLSRQELAFGE